MVGTDGLRSQNVNESGREEDQKHGKADPGQILQRWMCGQVPVEPQLGCNSMINQLEMMMNHLVISPLKLAMTAQSIRTKTTCSAHLNAVVDHKAQQGHDNTEQGQKYLNNHSTTISPSSS